MSIELSKMMKCPKCGQRSISHARFCSGCGYPLYLTPPATSSGFVNKILNKSRSIIATIRAKTRGLGFVRISRDKVIAGVCSGLAKRFGINLAIVRCVFVLAMSFGMIPGIIYALIWLSFDET